MASTSVSRKVLRSIAGIGAVAALTIGSASAGWGAEEDDLLNLGTAQSFGVLGFTTVTNTGPSVVNGDVGLFSGTSITGFQGGPGLVNGAVYVTTAEAQQAQADALISYNAAASLAPTEVGVGELNGQSLTPGVYDEGALELAGGGTLTLAGGSQSLFVFRAASELTIGSDSEIVFTGGASACNVLWLVGSSATIGTGADFRGTIIAEESVTANTSADIVGRLIAMGAAVTLDTNDITVPTGCAPEDETVEPTITSGEPTDATVGEDYDFTITADGNPEPEFSVEGDLPEGLEFDGETGTISGTPTDAGEATFTVTATNGVGTDDTATYTISVEAGPSPTPTPTAEGTGTGDGGGNDDGSGAGGGTDSGSDDLVVEGVELARTGFDNGALVTAAAALMLAGAAALAAGRRRLAQA